MNGHRQVYRSLAALVVVATTVLSARTAPASGRAGDRVPDADALDSALDGIASAGAPAAYAEVTVDGRRWHGASGTLTIGGARPARAGLSHRVGSVTKTFTAATVLQLVGEGRIRLDQPVATYLPDLPFTGPHAAVTVRMLLNQTSGIGDYDSVIFGTPADVERVRTTTYRPRELAELGLSAPRTGPPGERWAYSNTNYVLAGLLIERTTGRPAEWEITRRVIWPLGLYRTYFPATVPHLIGPNAHGYVPWVDGRLRDFTTYNMSWAWTAGALVSTTHDINRFLKALLDGRLLRPTELEQMRRTVPTNPADPAAVGYGLGLIRLPTACGDLWGHDGVVWGFSTSAFHRADGSRGMTLAMTISHYRTDPTAAHPIDVAIGRFTNLALCGPQSAARTLAPTDLPAPMHGPGRSTG